MLSVASATHACNFSDNPILALLNASLCIQEKAVGKIPERQETTLHALP
jgi:hypothetical protein